VKFPFLTAEIQAYCSAPSLQCLSKGGLAGALAGQPEAAMPTPEVACPAEASWSGRSMVHRGILQEFRESPCGHELASHRESERARNANQLESIRESVRPFWRPLRAEYTACPAQPPYAPRARWFTPVRWGLGPNRLCGSWTSWLTRSLFGLLVDRGEPQA